MYFLAEKIYADNGNEIIKNLKEEHIIIRLPKVYRWVGLIGAMIVSIGPIIVTAFLNTTGSDEPWVITGFGLFTLFGLYIAWAQIFWRIDVYRHGDHFILVTGLRIKHKSIIQTSFTTNLEITIYILKLIGNSFSLLIKLSV